jgi:hypothetical protein
MEMRVVKELERYHYGWFCLFSLDFGQESVEKGKDHRHFEKFENIFISSVQMDEIRDQINYLLEDEDEEDETVFDPIDETDGHDDHTAVDP